MNFDKFMRSKAPVGLASSEWSGFPLLFDTHDELLPEVEDFSVIDDFMSDMDMDDFADEFAETFPDYTIFAICDVGHAIEEDDDFVFDSYAEFFFCVDRSTADNAVLIWTGEGFFEPFSENFEEFHANLTQWDSDGD